MSTVRLCGLRYLLLALGVTFLLAITSFSVMTVKGESMSPTIREGGRVLVTKFGFPALNPSIFPWMGVKRGEIAVLRDPVDGADVVKRIIAVSGDQISVVHNRLKVAGRYLLMDGNLLEELSGLTEVPFGYVLVAGDLGSESFDSRHYGLVSIKALRGRVIGIRQPR